MSFQTNVTNLAIRIATEVKALRTLINGNAADNSALTTTAKANLVLAINEVNAKPSGGGATALSALTDVTDVNPGTGHVLRYDAATSKWVNVLGTTYFEVAGAAAAAQGASQPLNSNLTSIAALATTAYGRAFLTLANQLALMGLLSNGTTSAAGILQLATSAQTVTGTDTALAATSAGVKAAIDARIDNTTGLGASTTNAPSQAATKAYVDGILDAQNAFQYKGVLDCSANPNYPAASAGWTYKVSVAGKIGGASGIVVEVGDTVTCLVDSSAAGNQATVGANWIVMQTNVDGAVTGPATSTLGDLVTFQGTTGKVVQDSGAKIDTDVALATNANVPTSSAVKGYTYSQTQIGDPAHDFVADFTANL